MRKFDRRKFASSLGLGFLGLSLAKAMPLNFIKNVGKGGKKITINAHPSAVSRKKGSK